jgi:hypothetical protein
MDILFVMSIQYRVYGSKLPAILANSGQKKIFLSQIAIIPTLGAVFLVIFIWGIIIAKLHQYINYLPRVQNKSKRMTQQGWVIITGIILVCFSLLHVTKVKSADLNLMILPSKALKTNAVLSISLILPPIILLFLLIIFFGLGRFFKIKDYAVNAISEPCRRGAIIKYMAKMRFTPAAHYLGTPHAMGIVWHIDNTGFADGFIKTWPTATTFKLGIAYK